MQKINNLFSKISNKSKKTFLIFSFVLMGVLSLNFVDNDFEIAKNIDIFSTVIKELQLNYVDEINSGDIVKTAIKSMLESLDPYTVFYSEDEIEDVKLLTTGQYGGIGALIQQDGEYVIISDPYEGTPSVKSGLKAGDKILEINGKSTKNKTTSDVSSALKGQPGTEVKLLILQYGETKPIEKRIIREEIKLPNIPYAKKITSEIGYIKLSQFTENASKEVKDAFLKQKEEGIKSLILDLRGNGGGLLQEAVNIMNIFVDKNNLIVSTKGKVKERNYSHKTIFPPLDLNIPVVVLVDNSSASASEIVAGSFQDLDRGVIIGQRTYGKGLVQNVLPLSYNCKLKITVSKYYIPSGRCIQSVEYFDKNDNKTNKKTNDSLAVSFKTKNGRLVYDKGGVEPDIIVETPKSINIVGSLYTKQLFFEFANKFHKENPTIPSAKDFAISDKIYSDFVSFLKSKDYDYETESEKYLLDLKITAQKEKYFDAIKDDYNKLFNKLKHDKEADLIKYKKEISLILKTEIISRYYYQKGQYEAIINEDPEILKAIEILNDKERYNSILKIK